MAYGFAAIISRIDRDRTLATRKARTGEDLLAHRCAAAFIGAD
jgi:hypothetical protein